MRNATTALRVPADNPSPRNEVIERCLPLARSIAAKLRLAHGLTAPFDDLYASGVDGLMQAAHRFDPTRGVAFTTFAYYRIRGARLDSLRRDPQRQLLAAPRIAPARAPRAIAVALPANDNAQASDRSDSATEHAGWSLWCPGHLSTEGTGQDRRRCRRSARRCSCALTWSTPDLYRPGATRCRESSR